MVRGIMVEQLDARKRTEVLKIELENHGYKLPITELVNLLKRKVQEETINKMVSGKVCYWVTSNSDYDSNRHDETK
jgi:hypothetical protein